MTQRIDWNRDWEFTENFDDFSTAVTVSLPHTCRETPYDYFDEGVYQMVCGYRKKLVVPDEWAGRRVFLCVGAAGHSAEVFADGKKLAEHHCGYTAFRVELTDSLTPGREAELTIKVDSRESQDYPPFGYVIDYMTYGGLYREVWLEVTEKTRIADVFARPAAESGVVHSTVTVDGAVRDSLWLRQYVGEHEKRTEIVGTVAETSLYVPDAKRWDVDEPSLYTLVTELLDGETVLDRVETRIGFRAAEFRTDGFYLNGRKLKIVGLDRHQSYPYVGYAMPESMQKFDADVMKRELGLNAVRTSHYPQSQHFIDRCDELGLLVFTEIPGWQHIGGEAWKDQAVENVREMIEQYRNHPSIILWGVRINESPDDDAFYERTNELAHRLDPTRQTGGVRCIKKSNLLEDVYTYNDFVHDGINPGCDKKKTVTSDMDKPYLVTEYCGHMFPTKTYDSEEHRLEHALRHARVLDAIAAEDDIAGSFGWCLFDYNTHRDFGSGDRICYHGVMDMYRNPKMAAQVYAARQDEKPVLSVSSSFDIGEHPASNRGRVCVFTNADEVRMYKNGKFIRSFTHENSPFKNMCRPPIDVDDFIGDQLQDNEKFTPRQTQLVKELLNYSARFGWGHLPAEIKAKAGVLMTRYHMSYDDAYALYGKYVNNWGDAASEFRFDAIKNGEVVATAIKARMLERRLRADASHTTLVEGATYDVAAIRLALTDQNGNVLDFAQEPVTLAAEGPVEIIGPKAAMLRGGVGGTYIKTTGKAGKAALTLSIEGAEPVRIEFTVEQKGAN